MKANRLLDEKSPYLLQHAHNPVDWYPWGEEAFSRARREDKPVLLSIGYSTCHWCHVMERESFEDERIARLMNENFICVKLDREERPDVDKVYMAAVQAMTGQGGWPLNVFLTPELEPFFGGTYFPPEARWGQPAWPALLARIAELWRERRGQLRADAAKMAQALRQYAAGPARRAAPQARWLERGFEALAAAFDPAHKGFGGAPKFPMPANLDFLLRHHARTQGADALRLVVETLKAMAAGGVFDQLGGGFHRYSTDEQWRVPHFEKMLYDNAQLAGIACDAYLLSCDPELAGIARETLEYMLRELSHPEGGFFSAQDADSAPGEGVAISEGAFYVWTLSEVERLLGPDAALFCARYGVKASGNALRDPQGELSGRNVLYQALPIEQAAWRAGVEPQQAQQRLNRCRRTLLEARAARPRPGLDDKVIASWNGLAISALAKASRALGEPVWADTAIQVAMFLRLRLYDSAAGLLWRRWREGQRAVAGTADDYAFLAQGLLDLYEACGDAQWLKWALALTEAQQRLFACPEGGLYMTAEGHDPRLIARVVEDTDNVEPCASSVATSNLLRLWGLTQREDLRSAAQKTLERFGPLMEERPLSLPAMLSALSLSLTPATTIIVAGEAQREPTRSMLELSRRRYAPGMSLLQLDAANRGTLARLAPWTANLAVCETPCAYVCVGHACGLPLKTTEALAERFGVLRGGSQQESQR